MFWCTPFRNFLRKKTIFRNFDQWSEIWAVSAGRPLGQGVCPSLGNRVIVPARQAIEAGGIHSLESIPGLHKRLKIRAQANVSKKEMHEFLTASAHFQEAGLCCLFKKYYGVQIYVADYF